MELESLYLLSKARSGLRPREEFEALCGELVDSGHLRESRTLFGRRIFRLTDKGRQELLKAQHSNHHAARAVANGLFDHLPFGLFEQIVNSPEVDRYIESQQEVQRLILFSQWFPR